MIDSRIAWKQSQGWVPFNWWGGMGNEWEMILRKTSKHGETCALTVLHGFVTNPSLDWTICPVLSSRQYCQQPGPYVKFPQNWAIAADWTSLDGNLAKPLLHEQEQVKRPPPSCKTCKIRYILIYFDHLGPLMTVETVRTF